MRERERERNREREKERERERDWCPTLTYINMRRHIHGYVSSIHAQHSLADKATRLSKRRRTFSKYLQIKSWVLIYVQNLPLSDAALLRSPWAKLKCKARENVASRFINSIYINHVLLNGMRPLYMLGYSRFTFSRRRCGFLGRSCRHSTYNNYLLTLWKFIVDTGGFVGFALSFIIHHKCEQFCFNCRNALDLQILHL